MTEQEKIVAKIKATAQENLNKKLEEQKKALERNIDYDMKNIERCLQYIKNKMVYKIIGDNIYSNKYVLADENTFLEDFNKEPKWSYKKGIRFFNNESKPYDPLFEVNGESYYDMRFIIRNYK